MFSGRKCETTLTYGAYNKTLEVILRDTYVLHMLFNVSCNRPWRSLSLWRNASEEVDKKLQYQKVFLCAARWSLLKKCKERIHLVHFRSVEEEFRSRSQIKTSRNSWQYFVFMSRSPQNRWACGHSDVHRTKSSVKCFSAWTKKYFFK